MMSQSGAIGGLDFVVTNTLIVEKILRSVAFYRDILDAAVLREGEPALLRLGNIWLTINVGGGPTDDQVVVATDVSDAEVQKDTQKRLDYTTDVLGGVGGGNGKPLSPGGRGKGRLALALPNFRCQCSSPMA